MNMGRCACGDWYSTDNFDAGMCEKCFEAEREKLYGPRKPESGPVNLVPVPMERLLHALGWQGGTVEQVVAEVGRLVTMQAAFQGLFNKVNKVTATWRHQNVVRPADMESLVIRQIEVEPFQAKPQPLGQGVAALLPEHGEATGPRYKCKRNGKYLVAGNLNGEDYDGHGEPFIFNAKQAESLDRLGYDLEPQA